MGPKRFRLAGAPTLTALLATVILGLASPCGAAVGAEKVKEVEVDSEQGMLLRFVAEPKFRLSDVRIDGRSVGVVSTYRLTGVSKDVSVEATFVSEVEVLLPSLESPVGGGTVTSLTPALSVYNPLWEGTATYEFQVATDEEFANVVAAQALVPQGFTTTSWTVPTPLVDKTRYYWRVRATEDDTTGPWMTPSVFIVNLGGAATTVTVQVAGYLVSEAANAFEVPGQGKGAKGLAVEVPAGSVNYDTIFAAGSVTNAPAAGNGVKVLSEVYELSPHGVPFLKPVTLKIPYTDAAITQAGVQGPEQLRVFTYNTDTLAWEPVAVASVDRANKQLVCELTHFSLYAVGAESGSGTTVSGGQTGGNTTKASSDSGGGGGGGGCFISSTAPGFGTSGHIRIPWSLPVLLVALAVKRRRSENARQ